MSLYLHVGPNPVTRQALAMIPTPPPIGPRHHPYPFIDFVNQVEDGLNAAGLRVVEEMYGTTNAQQRFFGVMTVEPMNRTRDKGYELIVGLRGAHDQSLPRGLVAGSQVVVCSNLCFSGEVNIKTRQTTFVERRMPGLTLNAVRNLAGQFQVQDHRFDQYRQFELKPRWGDAAIVELMRRQVITPTQLPRVIHEWDEPTHAEHAEDGHSVWRLHNAVTEAIKAPVDENGLPSRATAPMAMTRTIGLTKFLDEVVGFSPRLAEAA